MKNEVGEFLKKSGIKPSVPRMKIMEFLMKTKKHPSVDTIYKELCDEIPTLSKATVYNTLKLFVDNGVANAVNIEDNELRFDGDTTLHGHFKCKACDIIYDFDLNNHQPDISAIKNFRIDETQIYYKGICNKCLKKLI